MKGVKMRSKMWLSIVFGMTLFFGSEPSQAEEWYNFKTKKVEVFPGAPKPERMKEFIAQDSRIQDFFDQCLQLKKRSPLECFLLAHQLSVVPIPSSPPPPFKQA